MEFNDEKKEKLERLERKLYSRNISNIDHTERSEFNPRIEEPEGIKENWQNAKSNGFDELAAKVSKMAQKKHNFINKIFIFSTLFFVAACGVAIFVFFGGVNSISSKNVDIKVVGPLSVGGGQEVSFDISIINNNNVDLDSASLLLEYPAGTRSVSDLTKELDQERFALDKIKSGEDFNQNIKVVFFGEKEELKQLKISLEYRVENSSALFYKEKIHEISISSAPVIITPTYPKEVNSNQEISFNVEVASNSKDKVGDFLVNVEYPFGFVFKEATPKASYNNNIWRFGSLNSGEKKTITIKGSIIGQDNEEKVFKINVGTGSLDDERKIAVPFSQSVESILVKKPFIGLDVSIEGGDGDFAAQGGEQIGTEFTVKNNLPSRLFNTVVEVTFKGGAFNRSGVLPGNNGFFQSSNDTILWDKRLVPGLSDMGPGSEERLSFRLTPLLYSNIAKGVRPEIEITIKARGERILESGSVEMVSSVETRKIVLATDITLSSKIVRSAGNLENSGPIPPKADAPTTYTVVWSINNSFNQVSNVEVRATLPSYVKWTNIKSPASEIFSFNPVSNEVVWSVGSVLPNTGFDSPAKEIYFQLEFLPSVSQIGQTPSLLGGASLSGIDKITGLKIETRTGEVTTDFSGDPGFKMGDERVVQ
ncbi:MAG: hypothetical protein A3A96_02830 [Candidatus Zambryskibacteria bacterium RIFCSPLOWO2_01_FULL_39_39]|uniref:DUF11 domain-containing protein n=1 Tax=Candidatus Zambryskibacteria bacterium RIFCSPLOWO2_01_FULL_39_39 TaxID=1802758 RepID=A0A1G2TYD4_9BACT|nr:MAG: hypothetical protein UT00_C0002G0054 [Parcubacteria group bacterium GW2011_GWA1_38_7]OHA86899.1 MAG: hypothetical protein A2644_00270 [Candidatus Zambryskibacteria bacterium RIFCSPHIGHO2_01_FULL_39_63]OHA94464.1 MAG: hypothetical protein A3B88_02090 [Candidatus Zambryskibacteria bacterium RIFCSPHIGHO2_02_FULL_39_19]OHA98995.1 MAG: hypothetical protein A3F20_00415 [Candidatus Zambryskibacteria bacterium RIFCSPHIGHO2_12_FULL_39_21]OHB01582.1 MAG: hypothetical protein A3A96_02830 [Candidat